MGRPPPAIAITLGDPAGVGPELCCRAAHDPEVLAVCQPVVVGSRALLERVAECLGLRLPDRIDEPPDLRLDAAAVVPGRDQAACGAAAAACIEHALALVRTGRAAALTTCPISKAAIHAAGIDFPGHTELLAERCGGGEVAMMLYDERIAVVLATCHQALSSVPQALTTERLVFCGRVLADALRRLRGRPPRLAMLGLNPHAGEHGLFGDEEARCIAPAVAALRALGITISDPLPPDTAFTPAALARHDGHVCCYHDQALIPFKALAFDTGVNVTLGLPVVRTSVDHGTAYDIAWTGKAEVSSLIAAVRLAVRLAAPLTP